MIPRRRTPVDAIAFGRAFLQGRHGVKVIEAFESQFARYVGRKHAIATCSGRAALLVALEAAGLGPGDEVIVPAYTLIDLPELLEQRGLRPVFADVLPETYLLDPASVARALSPRTRAILPTDIFGAATDWNELLEPVLRGRDVAVIEDAAHAVGSTVRGLPVGSFAPAAFYSLETIKLFHSFGGGLLVTDDDDFAARARGHRATAKPAARYLPTKFIRSAVENVAFRTPAYRALLSALAIPGLRDAILGTYAAIKYDGVLVETGYTAWQAAFASEKLAALDAAIARRRETARVLMALIDPCIDWQREPDGTRSNRYFLVGLLPPDVSPDRFRREVLRGNVDVGIGSEITDLCAPAGDAERFPIARLVHQRAVQFPLFDGLSARATDRIADGVNAALRRVRRA